MAAREDNVNTNAFPSFKNYHYVMSHRDEGIGARRITQSMTLINPIVESDKYIENKNYLSHQNIKQC